VLCLSSLRASVSAQGSLCGDAQKGTAVLFHWLRRRMELLQCRELAAEPSEEILHTVLGRRITMLHRRAGPRSPFMHTHIHTPKLDPQPLLPPLPSLWNLHSLLTLCFSADELICLRVFVRVPLFVPRTYARAHTHTHTHTHINLQARSQLTPAEYNTNPHRLSPTNTHLRSVYFLLACFFPSPVFPNVHACVRIWLHATTLHLAIESGGWCIRSAVCIADKRRQCQMNRSGAGRERMVSGGGELLKTTQLVFK